MISILTGLLWLKLAQPVDESPESVKHQVEAQYAKRAHGILAKDVRSVLDVLAPGFKQKYISGQITDRTAWENALRTRLEAMKADEFRAQSSGGRWKNPESVTTAIQKVSVSGTSATVSAVTVTTTSATYPKGLTYKAAFEETSEDTWVKTALGWRLQTIEQIRNRTSTDEMKAKPSPKAGPNSKK